MTQLFRATTHCTLLNRTVQWPTEVRDYDSDTVVQLARVTALSCQAAVQRSSSRESADLISKRLSETQRRIAESQDRIRRTDRLLALIQQKMVYDPVKRIQNPHLGDDSLTLPRESQTVGHSLHLSPWSGVSFLVAQRTNQYPALRDDFDQLTLDVLFTDVDLALTFTDVARNVSGQGAIIQTIRNARKAYNVISRERSKLAISEDDSRELDTKLVLLRRRLQELGETFD